MERQYEKYADLVFNNCDDFTQVNFTIAAYCPVDKYNLHNYLEEVPVETDWLCIFFSDVTIKTGMFSRFSNLKSLYLMGDFKLLPESFERLTQLTTLWILPHHYTVTGKLDFGRLNNLQRLKLNEFQFSDVNMSTFGDLTQLKQLDWSHNEITSFSLLTEHLTKLKYLQDLFVENKIHALQKVDCVSDKLSLGNPYVNFSIRNLSFGRNQIHSLENNSLCNFPKLSFFKINLHPLSADDLFYAGIETVDTMSLADIQFGYIEICVYASYFKVKDLRLMNTELVSIETANGSCSTLETLDVSYNMIEKVSFLQIEKLKNLTDLNISNNRINALAVCPNTFSIKMELLYLNISFNFITSLEEGQFACQKNLKMLDLSNNQIAEIRNCTFCGLKVLEVLHLDYNHIYMIQEYAFSDLFALKQLNLYGNQLNSIDEWAFYDLHQIEELTLTFTYDVEEIWWSKHIANTLNKLSLKTTNTYITLLYENFNNLFHLENLELDAQYLYVDICEYFPFHRIKELHLLNNIVFDCMDATLPVLGNFINLEKLYYRAYYTEPLEMTVTINSSIRYLEKLEFLCLDNTEKFAENLLINPYELFQGLVNLKTLQLINSGLEYFTSNMMFNDLKSVIFLLIENQNIKDIKAEAFSPMSNLNYIYLYDTTLACNCQLNWFNQWLLYNKQVSFIDFYDQKCLVRAKKSDSTLSTFLDSCTTDLQFTLFIASFVGMVLFILIILFHESIWWYTLYLFYTVKCWLNRRKEDEQYKYDVFVSYNTTNEQWITEELLPNLENNGPPIFKVCIHNRDFEIGRDIVENIVDSIYKSRWTICLITHSYLQSYWCSLELRMATYKLVAENNNSLILIFLDKISKEEIQCYHRLTKLLDKKTYLEWPEDPNGQKLFWARLRKVIGIHVEKDHDEL
ncbi:toll-like receptor 13 [Pelobates fuscus]|uniref:toll-like receptor 13 n=1 Tax=Pelobates fuscus TaxID=191477 RepID=UPI002FE4A98F